MLLAEDFPLVSGNNKNFGHTNFVEALTGVTPNGMNFDFGNGTFANHSLNPNLPFYPRYVHGQAVIHVLELTVKFRAVLPRTTQNGMIGTHTWQVLMKYCEISIPRCETRGWKLQDCVTAAC